ncbi:MAG: nicotinate-nucleotide adenylyltransferase [Clostridiales Family XIII bacterium]|jgi:nicotinate-nucleotide adenylyltransferase|nr:nicotinate-nucleotide adenylyltransferase [Clostridiales Family XIII bacterium]
MNERVGVFGGTFDPVHTGHLLLAEAARAQAGLSRVLFMPAHIQPFKQDAGISPDDDRLRMLSLAISDNPGFGVTLIEIEQGGVSYTIDSLRALRSSLGGMRLCFIIGTDMFLMIGKWKEADALVREFDFAVGVRPGYLHGEAVAKAEALKQSHGTRVDFVDNPPIRLSSTELRECVKNGGTIRYLVPESVRRYLLVREREGERRFAHTKRVVDLASEMAKRFGADAEKAALAALLHDYCKDSGGGAENDVAHGAMAADAARREFGVTDEDVLNAIRYHTTGRAGMSRLELIVFLADTVEPGRTYDRIARLRDTCRDDLEKGALDVLIELKLYLEKKGLAVSEDTEAAIEDLRHRCRKEVTIQAIASPPSFRA